MKERLKSLLLFGVLIGLLLVVLLVGQMISRNHSRNLAAMDAQIQDVQMQMESIRVDQAQQEADVNRAVNGLDTARVERDQNLIQDFLKDVCTWEDVATYQTKLEALKKQYPEDDNAMFYVFFADPTSEESAANMTYLENASVYVTNIADNNYTYFTEVTVSSTTEAGQTGTGTFAFECTVDGEGTLSGLSAYVITNH